MGITSEEFFENIYKVIFSPKDFFENENQQISLRLAAGTAVFLAAVNKFASLTAQNGSLSVRALILSIVLSVICSLFVWTLAGLFFEYAAKIFSRSGNLAKFLYLSAFSFIPSLFYAPLSLLKNLGAAGYLISAILSFTLYIWIIYLYAYALKSAYKLTFARSFMIIFLPFAAIIPAVYQTVSFYNEMRYIFAV